MKFFQFQLYIIIIDFNSFIICTITIRRLISLFIHQKRSFIK
uniref:Uncharacterized protein n=1 Tax=Schistosoma curassoni TaxID=6186 RepID=A0A183JSW6_9TREM